MKLDGKFTPTRDNQPNNLGPGKRDLLVDRDCVILDGSCKCIHPWDECKYLKDDIIDGHYDSQGRYIRPDERKGLEE